MYWVSTMSQTIDILFTSHGGGPLPLLGDAGHRELVEKLQAVGKQLPRPDAILVISAHWEEATPTITAGPQPELIYDYYGFPPESYSIEYPAPGDPALAASVAEVLSDQGIETRLDDERGFDHGLFIPLLLMYPDADIPCVQLSLVSGLDPEAHIRVGAALSNLARDDVLVIGSGFSFHNLKVLLGGGGKTPDPDNEAFEAWLIDTCTSAALDSSERHDRLINWAAAPGARYCHPREEHLLPLHVCYGMTRSACLAHGELTIMGKKCSTYFW